VEKITVSRAVVQAVSWQFFNEKDKFRYKATTCGICGEQSGTNNGVYQAVSFYGCVILKNI